MEIIEKTDEVVITFDKDSAKWILSAFGFCIDKENYITKNKKRVKTITGKTCKLSEFGGLMKGKNNRPVIIKNNIEELLELAKLKMIGE